jgi:competence protein ComEA
MKKIMITLFVAACLLVNLGIASAAENKDGKINLNAATKEQLVSIGLDDEIAQAIIDLREENGEFVDMDELLEVEGMDGKLLRQLKKKIYIEAAASCNC